MRKNRSRDVFKASTSTKTFQSPDSVSVHGDPLECHLRVSNSEAFLPPLPLLSLVDLIGPEFLFFLCEAFLLLLLLLLLLGPRAYCISWLIRADTFC